MSRGSPVRSNKPGGEYRGAPARANPPALYRCPHCGETLSGPGRLYQCPGTGALYQWTEPRSA